jgi:hypothetical protein
VSIGRYSFTPKILGNTIFGTSRAASKIYRAIDTGAIPFTIYTLKGSERLDVVAGRVYGNASLWWIIAAASGIGWGLQCPPGTMLRIPTSPAQVVPFIR